MHCKDPTVFPFSSTRINWVRMHQYILYIVNLHFLRYPSVWTWLMKVDLLQGWARLAKDGFFRFGSSPLPFFSSGRRASIMSWLHRCISSLSVFFNSRYRRSELVDTSGIQSEFFALNILIFRGFCVLLFVYLRLDQVEVIPSFGDFFCFVLFLPGSIIVGGRWKTRVARCPSASPSSTSAWRTPAERRRSCCVVKVKEVAWCFFWGIMGIWDPFFWGNQTLENE